MSGTGTMDEAGTCASYELRWLGVAVRQSTRRERDVITVQQQGPGFLAAQTLVRRVQAAGPASTFE